MSNESTQSRKKSNIIKPKAPPSNFIPLGKFPTGHVQQVELRKGLGPVVTK